MMRKESLLLSVYIYFTAGFRRPTIKGVDLVPNGRKLIKQFERTGAEYEHRCSAGLITREALGVSKVSSALPALWMGGG